MQYELHIPTIAQLRDAKSSFALEQRKQEKEPVVRATCRQTDRSCRNS